jgi:hypothetical protein
MLLDLFELHSLGILVDYFPGVSDQHADSHWVLDDRALAAGTWAELLDKLGDGHPVFLPDQIQQTKGMVLHDVAAGGDSLVSPLSTTREVRGGAGKGRRRDGFGVDGFLSFVGPTLDDSGR